MTRITFTLALVLTSMTLLTGCLGPALIAGAATGATMAHDRRTSGTIMEDKAIQLKADHELRENVALKKDAHIVVTSYNNNVLIVGQVPSHDASSKIEALVQNIAEVKKVYNELEVAPPVSMKTISHDSWITTKIKSSSMNGRAGVDPLRTKVITENGVVYLMGIVSRAEADNATELARKVEGVKRVVRVFEYTD
ncbi:MAG: BON domain-containing protein [Gammaproteobacteria bacterium]